MNSRYLHWAWIALMTICAAFPAHAQSPLTERGFKPELAYQFNGFDTVTLFNGNLILGVPLGPSYQVDPVVSYSFVLRYSGKLWEQTSWEKPRGQRELPGATSLVAKKENAGLGWSMSFGELLPPISVTTQPPHPWRYRSPDGSIRTFYVTLHDPPCIGSQTQCDPASASVRYTRDGTYLRLTDAGPTAKILEFPSGERHRFEGVEGGTEPWKLKYIYSVHSAMSGGLPSTNYVKFTYTPQPAQSPQWENWDIEDSHGRKHVVTFTNSTDYAVDRIAKIDTLVDSGVPYATYELDYETDVNIANPCLKPGETKVTFLREVLLASQEKYKFTYNRPVFTSNEAALQVCSSTAAMTLEASGLIASATVPTLGRIEWAYQNYFYSVYDSDAAGVSQRLVRGPDNAVLQRTDYDHTLGATTVLACTNMDPAGPCGPDSKSINYHSHTWDEWFGTPFTRSVPASGAPNPVDSRYLSAETYDCDPASPGACTLQRRNYVQFELDAVIDCLVDESCYRDRNRRVLSERTVYVTDGGKVADVDRASFDGLGHYRTTTFSGTFDGPDNKQTRATWTNFNPSQNVYSVAGGTRQPGFVMLPATASWVLGTYTDAWESENGVKAHSEACFDSNTGFLSRGRTLKGTTRGSTDILAVYTRDPASGFVAEEQYFGGDDATGDAAIGTGAHVCGIAIPASTSKRTFLKHQYGKGTLLNSRYVGPAADMPFKTVDITLNPRTGFIEKSRDSAERETTYTYDSSGRIERIQSAGPEFTSYDYDNASATTPASVTVETGPAPGTTVIYEYDGMGRVALEKRRMPSDPVSPPWSARKIEYDVLGRRKSVSELAAFSGIGAFNPPRTQFSGYDAFGRAGTVTAPDQSVTTFQYLGDSRVTRITSGGGSVAIGNITTIEEYDRQGRLISVKDSSGPAGQVVTTAYTYGPGNRLASVAMSGVETVQNRVFSYDGRGFLQWESHPESGVTAYTYDRRGHVLTKEVGAAKTHFDLRYAYDAAERLTLVEARTPGNPAVYREIKSYLYGEENFDGNYRKGKLITAVRYNYPAPGTTITNEMGKYVRVSESYSYYDLLGRRTHRTTTIERSNDLIYWDSIMPKTVALSVEYNSLSLPSKLVYPMCYDCGVPPTNPALNLQPQYDAGRTKSVSGFITGMTYWPNGLRNTITHNNEVKDIQEYNASDGMARPTRMKSEVAAPCTAPKITRQTEAATVSASQPAATLSVDATGTPTLTFQWWRLSGSQLVLIPNETGSTITVSPTSTTTYMVDVSNGCNTMTSREIVVEYGTCVQPWIATVSGVRAAGGQVTLAAAAGGTGTLQYAWIRLSDQFAFPPVSRTQGEVVTVAAGTISAGTTYELTVTNGCGGGAARTVVVDVPAAVEQVVVSARKTGTGQITIEWTAVPGAASYKVSRTHPQLVLLAQQTARSYVDGGLPADQAFVYSISAFDSAGREIARSSDLASTFTFSLIEQYKTIIAGAHATQLLTALNAVRGLSGWAAVTWTNILLPTDPIPAPNALVFTRHITALRARLNEAVHALGAPIAGYTDPDLRDGVIKTQHLTELQQRMQ